jgi:hypothetical protein
MNNAEIKNAPKYAWKNSKSMQESETCGCYQCLQVMSVQEIEEWTDYGNTAICPKCGCDCLIPQSSSIPMYSQALKIIRDYWLGSKK